MTYIQFSQDDLLVVALGSLVASGTTATFEKLVAKCFELFPEKFCLQGYPQWPNAVIVNKAWLRCRTDKKFLTGSVSEGFNLTPKGQELARKTMELLSRDLKNPPVESTKKKGDRQTMEGRVVRRIEKSIAYRKFQEFRNIDSINEYEFCDLLYGTMESTAETLSKNYEVITQNLASFKRADLIEFMKSLRTKFSGRFLHQVKRGGMLPKKTP